VFLICDIMRLVPILGSVHSITVDPDLNPDPALFVSCFLRNQQKIKLFYYYCTNCTSIYLSLQRQKVNKKSQNGFFIFLLVDGMIRIREAQKLMNPKENCSNMKLIC
jgi:hypothetical protein